MLISVYPIKSQLYPREAEPCSSNFTLLFLSYFRERQCHAHLILHCYFSVISARGSAMLI